MTATSIDIDTVSRITDTDEAERLGNAAYRALLDDLRTLEPDDWRTATVCAPWTISDIVRHLLGAAKANASIGEFLRQQIHGARHKSEFDGSALDATNALQVADHVSLDRAELLAELERIYGKSVRTRMSRSRLLRRLDVPVDDGGSSAAGMPNRLNLGELLRVVYTRDVWLHRVDIARALDREPPMEAAVDGLSLIHISEPTRPMKESRMPACA